MLQTEGRMLPVSGPTGALRTPACTAVWYWVSCCHLVPALGHHQQGTMELSAVAFCSSWLRGHHEEYQGLIPQAVKLLAVKQLPLLQRSLLLLKL